MTQLQNTQLTTAIIALREDIAELKEEVKLLRTTMITPDRALAIERRLDSLEADRTRGFMLIVTAFLGIIVDFVFHAPKP